MNFKHYATHSVLGLIIAGTTITQPVGTALADSSHELSAQCVQARKDVVSHEKSIETLKARHSELVQQLRNEQDARQSATAKLADLEAAAMGKKAEISTAHQQIERATARIEELTSAIAQLDSEIAEHAKALAAATQELADAQRKLDPIATAQEQARAKVEQANELVRQAQSNVASAEKALQDEKERYTSAVAEQARKSAQTKQELKKVTEQLATAPQTLDELKERLAKAQAGRDKATEHLNLLRKVSAEKVENSRTTSQDLEGLVVQQDNEIALKNKIDADIKKLDDTIAQLSQSPENAQQVVELTAQRQSQLRKRARQEGNITDLNNLVTKIRSDLAELEEEIRKVADQVLLVEQELQTAIRDATQAEQAIKDQRTNIDVLPKKIEALKQQLATLGKPISNDIAAREHEVEIAKKQLTPLESRLHDEQADLDKLEANYGKALAAKDAQEQKVNVQTQQVEKLRKARDKAQADLENMQHELDEARKAHDDALAELDSLQHQIADAKGSLDLIGDSSAELKKIANELETKRILHSNSVKTEKERCAPKQLMPKHPEPMAPEPTQPAPAQPIQKATPANVQHKASGQLAQTGVAPGEALLGAGALIGLG
ncbi:hypothetical protein, partial [Arcanobacterium phocae]|uniref:hypothetical protein n=1 Tax=Arcanobacterium phocae TaxID=131112 RepID=UPI001C0EBACB